ncbi:MAG TPA: allantoinase AllB [Candidatus Acidoferrales bacterium]|nr:allantoinase AllB [Candidatus Acidoferrales bacterium]
MSQRAYISRRVVTPEGIRAAAVLVDGERIGAVLAIGEIPPDAERHDLGDRAILPGLVDSHVHINEPGRTEWEGFETATRAAAAGGYTMLVDMPLNCLPATTNVAALEEKRAAARGKSRVDWAAWGGVVSDNAHEIEALAGAGVLGFKCFLIHPGIDGFTMVTEQELRAAAPCVARTGLPLLVHAEVPGPVEAATARLDGEDWRSYATYLRSRPDEAELGAIRCLIALGREFRLRLHIVHLSTSGALDCLRSARDEGLAVTVETCPHYLHFAAQEISDGATLFKCAPPIRGQANREELWQGIREGLIDLVATDHSPCPPAMKKLDAGDFQTAWGGISSLSVALPVMWTEAQKRGFALSDIARWMAERPARLAGCASRKGRIAVGSDADFIVFDPEAEWVVTKQRLHQRHALSPYLGERLCGVVQATYVRGKAVFESGQFPSEPSGKEQRR